jgi:hypothetical protein
LEDQIRHCVQKITEVLGRIKEINILRLVEYTGEHNALTYQALGWLAHEGRIHYRQEKNQVFVSLLPRLDSAADSPK